jgi:hypothetical protein
MRRSRPASCARSLLLAQARDALPDVPTLKELGYDVEFSIWVGLFAPKGTPDAVITRLRAETKKVVASEQFKAAIANIGDVVAISISPSSRHSGMRTPSASKQPCNRSERWRVEMDRRTFVVGSAASAALLPHAARRAGRLSRAADHHPQCVPAGRHQRRGDAAGRDRARGHLQAAGRGRDQGRRGRLASARRSRRMPSRTATRCSRTTTAFRVTPRSTSCSAARRRRRAPISFRWRGCAPIRCWCWSTTSSPYKTLAEFVERAKKEPGKIVYSSGGFYGASHLPVALLEQAAGITGMRHLPTAGGGPAITAVLGNNAQLTTQTVQATSRT